MSAKFPVVGTAGQMVPFLDANRKREIVNIVFENIGGIERFTHEAAKDPKWFLENFWAKLLPRGAVNVEHSAGAGIEDLLDKMDKAANAKTIDGSYTETQDAPG